jgi:hypothetical protein
VNREISKLGAALALKKASAYVIKWDSALGKGVDDLIVAHGKEAFESAKDSATRYEYWEMQRLTALTYPISHEVSADQRYITEKPIAIPEATKFTALRAPKGTGKTEFIKGQCEAATANGQRVLLITHRQQLTQALCDRTGIPSIYQILQGSADDERGYGLCVQSLHPTSQAHFDATEWADALIVIDECEQVIWEMLNSSTCQTNRIAILREFQTLMLNAFSADTDGRLLIADADLSDTSIKGIAGIVQREDIRPFIIRSQYKGADAA